MDVNLKYYHKYNDSFYILFFIIYFKLFALNQYKFKLIYANIKKQNSMKSKTNNKKDEKKT